LSAATGTLPTRGIVELADLVVFIGCRAGSVTTERWRFPAPGKTRIIHVDADPAVIGATYRTDVAIVGDAKLTRAALHAELTRRRQPSEKRTLDAARVKAARDEKFAAFAALARSDERPIKPERVVADLQAVAPVDATIVADPGTPARICRPISRSRGRGGILVELAHGALGYAMSAAAGAAPAGRGRRRRGYGRRQLRLHLRQLETIVRLKLPIAMLVFPMPHWWIKAGQRSGFGQRYFSVDFNRTDHAAVAAAFGSKLEGRGPGDAATDLEKAIEAASRPRRHHLPTVARGEPRLASGCVMASRSSPYRRRSHRMAARRFMARVSAY
jgi:acetolactate synthase-1/2/3 large subunit